MIFFERGDPRPFQKKFIHHSHIIFLWTIQKLSAFREPYKMFSDSFEQFIEVNSVSVMVRSIMEGIFERKGL